MAELRAASEDIVCCFLGASTFGAAELTGFELGRAVRCCRKGDLSGIGGGGVEGGGEVGAPVSFGELDSIGGLGIGGLGKGGRLGLLILPLVDDIIGKAPGTGGGAWNGGGVAGLALALRNELPANDSGVIARGNDSLIAAAKGGLKNISPEGLAGRFGGMALSLRSASDGNDEPSTIDSTKLPASLLRLGGPGGGGGGGGSNVAGKLIPLPPSWADLPFLLPSPLNLGFLNFHVSLSVSRISSTPPPLLLLPKRPDFFGFVVGCCCCVVVESEFLERVKSLALLILDPPVLLARLACSCARRAWISARERVAVGGGANIAYAWY